MPSVFAKSPSTSAAVTTHNSWITYLIQNPMTIISAGESCCCSWRKMAIIRLVLIRLMTCLSLSVHPTLWFPVSTPPLSPSVSSYSQFRECVHDPLLRECGNRARNLMDHSMAFLISRCRDKSHFRYCWSLHALFRETVSLIVITHSYIRLDQRCPSPPPIIDSQANAQHFTETDPAERQDRSFDSMPPASYDHQMASDQESLSSSSGFSMTSMGLILQLLLVLITVKLIWSDGHHGPGLSINIHLMLSSSGSQRLYRT